MQFIGSVTWDWEGKRAFKIRNKLNDFVWAPDISLDIPGFDPRYVEFYVDFAGAVWAKRPAGPQIRVRPPYSVVTRTSAGLVIRNVLDS